MRKYFFNSILYYMYNYKTKLKHLIILTGIYNIYLHFSKELEW